MLGSLPAIIEALTALITSASSLITQSIQAHATNDQAKLDAIYASAMAASNAMDPKLTSQASG